MKIPLVIFPFISIIIAYNNINFSIFLRYDQVHSTYNLLFIYVRNSMLFLECRIKFKKKTFHCMTGKYILLVCKAWK